MPFTTEAVAADQYILVRHEGVLTRRELLEGRTNGKKLLDTYRLKRLLVDLRGVTNCVPIADAYHIIVFDKVVFPLIKIAVIFPPEREENGRFADNVAANRGVKQKSFVDHEQAVAWLTGREG